MTPLSCVHGGSAGRAGVLRGTGRWNIVRDGLGGPVGRDRTAARSSSGLAAARTLILVLAMPTFRTGPDCDRAARGRGLLAVGKARRGAGLCELLLGQSTSIAH